MKRKATTPRECQEIDAKIEREILRRRGERQWLVRCVFMYGMLRGKPKGET